jgi:hypothetical protein
MNAAPRLHVLGGTAKPVEAYGTEPWWIEIPGPPPPMNCHDCNVVLGGFHGFGCDMERCPHDGSQALTCECEIEEFGS